LQWGLNGEKTVHEELVSCMSYILTDNNDQHTKNLLLLHSQYFFNIILKSIAQHLKFTNKCNEARSTRFPISFNHVIKELVGNITKQIIKKWQSKISETSQANTSLANFIKQLFTYHDRGFVFKLINIYLQFFKHDDGRVLFELKFAFIKAVCSHEHFIQLNLPLPCKYKSDYSYSLDEQFCKTHFLVGLLLKHLSAALHCCSDIRWIAIKTFRDIIAKQVFDDRYQTKKSKERIASLYLPFLRIILDNSFLLKSTAATGKTYNKSNVSREVDQLSLKTVDNKGISPNLTHLSSSGGSLRIKKPDNAVMNAIANPQSSLQRGGLRSSVAMVANIENSNSLEKLNIADNKSFESSLTMIETSEKCDILETRSLLLCYLQIIEHLHSDALVGFWKDSTSNEILEFFDVLQLSIHHFRYIGKKHISQNLKSKNPVENGTLGKSKSLMMRNSMISLGHINKNINLLGSEYLPSATLNDEDVQKYSQLQRKLSNQIAMIVLDVIADYTRYFKVKYMSKDVKYHHYDSKYKNGATNKKQLAHSNSTNENKVMEKIIEVLLIFLQINQSENTLKHVFASLRLVLGKFPHILFKGSHDACFKFVYYTMRCCDSLLHSTRSEACSLLYLIMRKNYEQSSSFCRDFNRSYLQMIKAVSQLISEHVGIGSTRFQSSLSIINTFANSDKGMKHTSFPSDVLRLTRKIRTVLQSTSLMMKHQHDAEKMIQLQHKLADSYQDTPELRKTWLQSMANFHIKHKNYSEAAMCYLHIAALIAEHLKKKKVITYGATYFKNISSNIEKDELLTNNTEVTSLDDHTYNMDSFNEVLYECAELIEKAERYEILQHVFQMIIPYYIQHRKYHELSEVHDRLSAGYRKIVQVNRNHKRMLGTYFRVGFFGSCFNDEDGKAYIYKEPKLTQLSEISQRLQKMYGGEFGTENFKIIQESGKVEREKLNENIGYAQVTFVTPYFDEKEQASRVNNFEQNHDISNFCFETPFTTSGKTRGNIDEQWKKKTICTTEKSFPYIKKRIEIKKMRSFDLKPIEVAVEEMSKKCAELEEIVNNDNIDIKKLQLRLQGSVNCQVNAGPLAYARAFLDESKAENLSEKSVNELRNCFRKFCDICAQALQINEDNILSNQIEYHKSLDTSFKMLVEQLSTIMNEQLILEDDETLDCTSVFSCVSITSSIKNKQQLGGTVDDSSMA